MGCLLTPFGQVVVLSLVFSAFNGGYAFFRTEPSFVISILGSYGLLVYVAFWVLDDARKRQDWPCYDFGTFLFFGWPAVIPWYLIRTRGPKGILLALGVLGLIVLPSVTAFLVYLLTI